MDRVKEAQDAVKKLSVDNGLKNDYQVGNHLGVNSAHVWNLRNGKLSVTLDDIMVTKGILAPRPVLIKVEACDCGQVHTLKSCPLKRSNGRKRNRVSINGSSASSAARSIQTHMEPGYIKELIDLLVMGSGDKGELE